ncbi:MAG TPA: YtxH domain-containing protein [Candidatus Saccharimonadales bacterium]|nr:YtxH domain-containing protein [Candidatus Saccharimonadales bacterium]
MKSGNHSGAGMAVAGLAAGSLIGFAAGMLYAPKRGEETRRDLNNKYNEARSRMRYKSGRVKEALKSKTLKRSEDEKADRDEMIASESDIKPIENETS